MLIFLIYMKQKLLFFISLVIVTFLLYFSYKFIKKNYNEGFTLEHAIGNINSGLLLEDIYQPIDKNTISNKNVSSIWWHYPTFHLGSYEQITNNIKYPNNPDVGRCTPSSMCGAFYHDKKEKNIIELLPPIVENTKTRNGYFTTNERIITGLPYYTNLQNILY